jgi:hypothetical protein
MRAAIMPPRRGLSYLAAPHQAVAYGSEVPRSSLGWEAKSFSHLQVSDCYIGTKIIPTLEVFGPWDDVGSLAVTQGVRSRRASYSIIE